jgi:hypothetical protein
MKAQSNIPLPSTPERWKEGEYIYYVNHKDNGVQTAENAGKRYEADFTIVKELTAENIINSFTRMTSDPAAEQKVVDNIEVGGRPAIEAKPIYANKVATTIFPLLPASGNLKKGVIYSYANGAVMVMQDHTRTAFAPELTPNLFSFYREVTEGKEWIVGEQIALNATRTYNGKTYKCIQVHQSQAQWNPELTLGTLWQLVVTSSVWTVGVAYKVNDIVTYLGNSYKCLQAHTSITTWNPVAAVSLWKLQ